MKRNDDIGFRIKRISNLMEQQANASLKAVDLTLAQMRVLYYLEKNQDHLVPLKELEKFFQVSQPTMAGIVVRLEEKNFIQSGFDPNDKRIKKLALSDEGRKVCDMTKAETEQREQRIIDKLGPPNAQQLRNLLDSLYEILKEEEQK